MRVFLNPWTLAGRIAVAVFKIGGYSLIFIVQLPLFLVLKRPSEVVEEFGSFGRATVDALAQIVER